MTIATAFLLLIVVGVVLFIIYYLLKGSTGGIAVTRPLESRIDEYLDQRFENLIAEWSLTTRPKLQKFRAEKSPLVTENETKIAELKTFEKKMKATLDNLEERLDALEKELAETGKRKSRKGT